MPSANPQIVVPTAAKKFQPFHRIPRTADDTLPERKSVAIAAASDLDFWLNSLWNFYLRINVGNIYTWSAQFSVDSNGAFQLFVYSASTYGGTDCERSVLDSIIGSLAVYSDPSPWLAFPP